jgi:hypothetical protein
VPMVFFWFVFSYMKEHDTWLEINCIKLLFDITASICVVCRSIRLNTSHESY